MTAGFPPSEFWQQSPRSFVAIMEGAARAARRRADENTVLAYQVLAFYGMAMKGRLKELPHYLNDKPRPKKAQTASEMLAVLKGMASSGTPMNIRRVN